MAKRRTIIRELFIILIAIFFIFESTGCETIQKKFVRKNKETKPIEKYYELEKYSREPSDVVYKRHYIYWKTWQEELINRISEDNYKKNMRCSSEIVSNLEDMQRYLVKEKAKELEPYINKMRDIAKELDNRLLGFAKKNQIKSMLEKTYREIKREFSYAKVGNYIVADTNAQPDSN
ncbi:MAG: hypothetical protein COS99_01755 [Candidatus Omnitrophica bacterium CG07_land_8_20_14_0_80_42_15]|uniref:Uncharacterized protein n=1 Tax=Candidatus Aquitaenariimonas noxiae TaxID=1974741 RepID=A0A2J0L4D8_9BACT|nr:MAG: hypothetical protein COS99_01755 [Candidatus Omnitrophica bacterium CG07_land_8_20_14_0_80_42_15]